ncbi:MAG: hypothetical protein V1684_02655 [bacterium]
MSNKLFKQFLVFICVAFFISLAVNVFAQESAQGGPVSIVAFHQTGCQFCATQVKFFNENLKKNYQVDIKIYDILNNAANIQLFQAMVGAYGKELSGVPTVFVGEKVFSGHDGNSELEIIAEVKRCLVEGCQSPLEKLKDYNPDQKPVSIDEKYKNIGYVVLGGIGVLIIVIVAFTIKPKRGNKNN